MARTGQLGTSQSQPGNLELGFVAAGAGTYTLSGSGTGSVPTGSGAGIQVTNPAGTYTLSGSGTAAVPTGSGAGLQVTNPAGGTYTLSGSGTAAVPTGSGSGIQTTTMTATASVTSITTTVVNLSVTASNGTAPYAYQWHRSLTSNFTPGSGTLLAGATSNTLANTPPTTAIYWYKCVVTDNTSTVVTSTQATGFLYQAPLVIGFIGDSITGYTNTGASISPAVATGNHLKKMVGVRNITISDQSVSGSRADQWSFVGTGSNYSNAVAAFAAAGVQYVMVMLGTNDAAVPNSASNYQTNMGTMTTNLVAAGYTVILNYPPFRAEFPYPGAADDVKNSYLQLYHSVIDGLVNGTTILQGDTSAFRWFSQNTGELTDGIHPNNTGIQTYGLLWATAFYEAILVTPASIANAVWTYANRTLTG